jgi:hypothetical protein
MMVVGPLRGCAPAADAVFANLIGRDGWVSDNWKGEGTSIRCCGQGMTIFLTKAFCGAGKPVRRETALLTPIIRHRQDA